MKFTFTEVTGKERYCIKDTVTRGERFADDNVSMMSSVFYFTRLLGHGAEVTDKNNPGAVTVHYPS